MKASVDHDLCIGCGLCEGICPKVFKMNEDNLAEVIGEVNQETVKDAKEAEAQCPVEAIKINE